MGNVVKQGEYLLLNTQRLKNGESADFFQNVTILQLTWTSKAQDRVLDLL